MAPLKPVDLLTFMEDDDDYLAFHLGDATREETARGGSTPGRRTFHRGRLQGEQQLLADYFAENPTYSDEMFRRRFRMRQSLFLRIMAEVIKFDEYFIQKRNAAGQLGFSPHQKITAALRMLAYGASADSLDEYIHMGISISFI